MICYTCFVINLQWMQQNSRGFFLGRISFSSTFVLLCFSISPVTLSQWKPKPSPALLTHVAYHGVLERAAWMKKRYQMNFILTIVTKRWTMPLRISNHTSYPCWWCLIMLNFWSCNPDSRSIFFDCESNSLRRVSCFSFAFFWTGSVLI